MFILNLFGMKMAVCVLLVLNTYYIYRTVTNGLRMRLYGKTPQLIEETKSSTTGIVCVTFILIFCLVGMAELPFFHARRPYAPLFYFHEVFATGLLILMLVMKYWLTGEKKKHRKIHMRLACAFLVCYAVVLPTGLVLLYQM